MVHNILFYVLLEAEILTTNTTYTKGHCNVSCFYFSFLTSDNHFSSY